MIYATNYNVMGSSALNCESTAVADEPIFAAVLSSRVLFQLNPTTYVFSPQEAIPSALEVQMRWTRTLTAETIWCGRTPAISTHFGPVTLRCGQATQS
jgi:hypothetical protein